jgi:hypothetical protein
MLAAPAEEDVDSAAAVVAQAPRPVVEVALAVVKEGR